MDLGGRTAFVTGATGGIGPAIALPASGMLDDFTAAQLSSALDVNLRAPIVLTHALLGGWAARGSGHAVYIGSIASKIATAGSSVYSATKVGLRGFAQGRPGRRHQPANGLDRHRPTDRRGPARQAVAQP